MMVFCRWAQLYARRHFLFPPLNIEDYNDRVMAVVRCEAQVLLCVVFFWAYFDLLMKEQFWGLQKKVESL